MLVADGTLDAGAKVAKYVPELKDSAFGDATLRQVLDMTTGLKYSEDYADPKAEIWDHVRAGNVVARPPGWTGPDTFYEFLVTVKKQGNHGDAFAYKPASRWARTCRIASGASSARSRTRTSRSTRWARSSRAAASTPACAISHALAR